MNLYNVLISLCVILIVPLLLFSGFCCFKRRRHEKKKSKKEKNESVIDFGMPTGNRNLGNTCFFNSALQALLHTKSFRDYFLCLKHLTTHKESKDLTLSMSVLRLLLPKSHGSEDNSKELKNVLKAVGKVNSQFGRGTQEDSYELLNTLLSGVCDEAALVYEAGSTRHADEKCVDVRKLFTGYFISIFKYSTCDHVDIDFEKFTSLSIPIENDGSDRKKLHPALQTVASATETDVERGLSILTQEEEFEEKDLPCRICHAVGEKTLLKRMLLYQAPPVLFIHIDRLKLDGLDVLKNSVQVRFPKKLDLAKFCSAIKTKISRDDLLYELYAVIVHTGAIHSGHYYAFVNTTRRHDAERWQRHLNVTHDEALLVQEVNDILKEGKLDDCIQNRGGGIEGKLNNVEASWYYVSDQTIKKVSEEDVMNHKDAYILFYEAQ